jgi:hypothetical protein
MDEYNLTLIVFGALIAANALGYWVGARWSVTSGDDAPKLVGSYAASRRIASNCNRYPVPRRRRVVHGDNGSDLVNRLDNIDRGYVMKVDKDILERWREAIAPLDTPERRARYIALDIPLGQISRILTCDTSLIYCGQRSIVAGLLTVSLRITTTLISRRRWAVSCLSWWRHDHEHHRA